MDIKRFKESWRGAFSDRLNLNERKQSKKWKRYLLKEYNKGTESYLATNSEREFSNLFKVRDIETLYMDLYEEVGVDFAKWYARSFDKFIEKNSGNESTWRTTFSRIGQTEAGDKIILVQGTALKELKRNIGNLFKDPEFQSLGRKQQGRILQNRFRGITEYQAQRIVRTEATSAANEGIMQSASDIFPKSSLVKEWVSSQDGRTRAFTRGDQSDHLNMNGKVVGFNETFAVPELSRVVQMKKPADFRSGASAHNIVNCRCSIAVYPKEGSEVNEGVSLTGIGGGVSARTSQLIGDEILTSRKPDPVVVEDTSRLSKLDKLIRERIERNKPTNLDKAVRGEKINDEFFELLGDKKPNLVLNRRMGSSQNYFGNKIKIDIERHKKSINKVLAHEYGHEIHDQLGWIKKSQTNPIIQKFFKKHKKIVGEGRSKDQLNIREKLKDFWGYNNGLDSFNARFQRSKFYNRINEKKIRNLFKSLDDEIYKENFGATADILGALTKNRVGHGHLNSYYNNIDPQYWEYIAHAFEVKYVGNPILKKYFPVIHDDMIEMMDELIKEFREKTYKL